ncbi:hypothetical protein RFI_12045 [Reticulomyxa filosa]|uniref:Uncharacterized protein n=1 Tax=Reticulomyxa filosa TaxID=46433 RepID=X6NGQ7_RETFI|nr:hypothetical protein RFI_12045 [Reticulomyxa filosa]|eukprot:ETO25093.1 hypothetical protein RFI_12045 [Reticulomyxa filosa]
METTTETKASEEKYMEAMKTITDDNNIVKDSSVNADHHLIMELLDDMFQMDSATQYLYHLDTSPQYTQLVTRPMFLTRMKEKAQKRTI